MGCVLALPNALADYLQAHIPLRCINRYFTTLCSSHPSASAGQGCRPSSLRSEPGAVQHPATKQSSQPPPVQVEVAVRAEPVHEDAVLAGKAGAHIVLQLADEVPAVKEDVLRKGCKHCDGEEKQGLDAAIVDSCQSWGHRRSSSTGASAPPTHNRRGPSGHLRR